MRTLIVTLLLVSVAIVLGVAIRHDPGYVEIVFAGKTIETSLAFLAFVFLLFYVAIYLLVRLALYLFHLPENFASWRKQHKVYKARASLNQGLIDLAEGRWAMAEKNLVRFAEYSDATLLNYLAAARAAHHQNAHDRRDAYLKKAIENNPQADIAVGITQAELQLAHNQIEQAFATLNHLTRLSPKHIYIKKLLAKIYLRLGEWSKLLQLLPELKKWQLFPQDKLLEMEKQASIKQIEQPELSSDKLQSLWKSLSPSMQQDKQVRYHYCCRLAQFNQPELLEQCIRKQKDQQWDERLIRLYGALEGADESRQLQFAESILEEHDKSPMLYLTLGRLCIKKELWGKARSYLQQSIACGATVEACEQMVKLHTRLGEHDQALQYCRQGLALASSREKPSCLS